MCWLEVNEDGAAISGPCLGIGDGGVILGFCPGGTDIFPAFLWHMALPSTP